MRKANQIPRPIVFLLMLLAAAGCTGNSSHEEATGKGFIRAVHAVPDLGRVDFLIEEVTLGTVDYREVSGTSQYDDLTYDFNFDILLPGDSESTRLASRELSVVAGREYTFALTGTLESPEIRLWEQASRDWDAELAAAEENGEEISVLEVSLGHLASGAGELDFYLQAPGTAPAEGARIATVDSGDIAGPLEFSSGEYQLVITPAGQAGEYLFASQAFVLSSAVSATIVILDSANPELSWLSVRLFGSGINTELVSLEASSTLEIVHAAFNTDPLDVILEDGFLEPFVTDLAFGNMSPAMEIAQGERSLNITPAGNAGSFLAEEQIEVADATEHTLFLSGLPGQLNGVTAVGEARRLSTHASLRLFHGAARFDALDAYIVPAGSDIALLAPTVDSLAYTGVAGYFTVAPDTYDIVFTMPGSKTVVAGPLRIDLNVFGRYDVVTADSNQASVAQILLFPDEMDDSVERH